MFNVYQVGDNPVLVSPKYVGIGLGGGKRLICVTRDLSQPIVQSTLFYYRSPVFWDKLLEIEGVCPQYGTAVLKGSRTELPL